MLESNPVRADNEALCEAERAIERLGNMRTLYANVVARFLDDSAGNHARLRAAIESGDCKEIHQAAHSLKGLAAMCGATGVETILGELETAGTALDREQVSEIFERLTQSMVITRRTLSPYREDNPPGQ